MERKRKCVGCGCLISSADLIKITFVKDENQVILNPNSKQFGRSVYLCYNKLCIKNALRKNKLQRALKAPIPEELKGRLIEFE